MKLKNLRSKQRRNARRLDLRIFRIPPHHAMVTHIGPGVVRFVVMPRGEPITAAAGLSYTAMREMLQSMAIPLRYLDPVESDDWSANVAAAKAADATGA